MSKRADRIKEKVPLLGVLAYYGYGVGSSSDTEYQFRCDLHGDGSDNAPSARVYPSTNTWYCFACGKIRDSISTVMEKEGLDFSSACKALELKFGLPVWTWQEKDPFEETDGGVSNEQSDLDLLKKRIGLKLSDLIKARVLSKEQSLKYWEAYSMLETLDKTTEAQWMRLYYSLQGAVTPK
jgi:hypothetical protein